MRFCHSAAEKSVPARVFRFFRLNSVDRPARIRRKLTQIELAARVSLRLRSLLRTLAWRKRLLALSSAKTRLAKMLGRKFKKSFVLSPSLIIHSGAPQRDTAYLAAAEETVQRRYEWSIVTSFSNQSLVSWLKVSDYSFGCDLSFQTFNIGLKDELRINNK